jgi:Recombinase zinc beta ribbon domain/Recombinase
VPTRTGKSRWDRSVIWAMLRNPAYAGRACFGKTMRTADQPGLNRTARLAGRATPKSYSVTERPREDWLEIPVPALVAEDTWARAQQRLADNKRYAARNTKVPSLLQGLAACGSCGYAYYRGHTTTTAGNKIYYYRCLGSDNYRYEHGRVCDNKPVRTDYLDKVVWDHISDLLANPTLIRAEIDRRLNQLRTADPTTAQQHRLAQALTKTNASITRLIKAYQEELISLDELRARMPELRSRETSLRTQLDTLAAQLVDRDTYLKLATNLEDFLASLRGNTATIPEQQRVLRLLVKDILIGPERILIRHCIPTGGSTSTPTMKILDSDADEEPSPSSPLRWRSHQSIAVERRVARIGGCRRSPLPHRHPRRPDSSGQPGPDQICRRSRRVLPQPGTGTTGQGAAGPVAGSPRSGLQRRQDHSRAPNTGIRLPGSQRPPLPKRQTSDQAEPQGGHTVEAETRIRDARSTRLERERGPGQTRPHHARLGRLPPLRGVVQGLLLPGQLRVEAHLQVGHTQPR